jgi:geranylgeranyl reductase family protein
MRKVYDTIVIGAGPSGAASAYYLARTGLEVLLVDKEEFPRDKVCGDGLNSRALSLLSEIRITLEDLEAHGGVQIAGHRHFTDEHGVGSLRAPISSSKLGFGITRFKLDELIRQRAVAVGAEWLGRVEVAAVICGSQSETFVIHTTDHESFLSRSLAIASGAQSTLHFSFLAQHSQGKATAVGIRSYFRVSSPHNSSTFDFFHLSYLPGGYGWIFPVKDDLYNVGIWVAQVKSRSLKERYTRFMHEVVIPRLPVGWKMIAQPKGAMIGIRPKICSRDPFALLVGDAAHLADPVSGEGISYALESGKLSASRLIPLLG